MELCFRCLLFVISTVPHFIWQHWVSVSLSVVQRHCCNHCNCLRQRTKFSPLQAQRGKGPAQTRTSGKRCFKLPDLYSLLPSLRLCLQHDKRAGSQGLSSLLMTCSCAVCYYVIHFMFSVNIEIMFRTVKFSSESFSFVKTGQCTLHSKTYVINTM